MSRYFLHIFNRIGNARDDEGLELPDLAAARKTAIEGIRSIISEEARAGRIDLDGRVEIADESGQSLLVVPFSEAVELLLKSRSIGEA